MDTFDIYYWVTFSVSLFCLLKHPSTLPLMRNLTGSLLCAAFGFALWPAYMVACYKAAKRQDGDQ